MHRGGSVMDPARAKRAVKVAGRIAMQCAVLGFALVASARDMEYRGVIRGVVVEASGAPLAVAKVHAESASGRPTFTAIRYIETDAEGRFTIDRLSWDPYWVCALKEGADYPDTCDAFYGINALVRAEVNEKSPSANVRITMGAKAGVVEVQVTNARDGKSVDARIELWVADAPGRWTITSMPQMHKLLVPSSTDVMIRVTAPGFEPWTIDHPVRLEPEQVVVMPIALRPTDKK
jgi:hypothetical protein